MTQRGSKVTVICKNKACKTAFEARQADVKRGWGLYCSKSCKAIVQEKRTHQYADHIHKKSNGMSKETYNHYKKEYGGNPQFDNNGIYIGFTDREFDNTLNQNKDEFD